LIFARTLVRKINDSDSDSPMRAPGHLTGREWSVEQCLGGTEEVGIETGNLRRGEQFFQFA
jgi:hypothetical protein